ncbi:MAG: hypothetical protein O3C68_01410 [Proteobacteria bacterium]|nr:hypothetical protein [Pseudomonadota bacterium]
MLGDREILSGRPDDGFLRGLFQRNDASRKASAAKERTAPAGGFGYDRKLLLHGCNRVTHLKKISAGNF